jgi:hypothetical protein
MQNWLFRETRNFAKQPVSFAKQRNSFRIEFHETKSETSFAGNPNFMCVMCPSAKTGAGGLHVELCVPYENHRAYSVPVPVSNAGRCFDFQVIFVFQMRRRKSCFSIAKNSLTCTLNLVLFNSLQLEVHRILIWPDIRLT